MEDSVARAWLAAALVSAGAGVLQYLGWAAHFAPWINQAEVGQVYANLRQRNQFATLMNIGLAALLWQAASRRGNGATGLGWFAAILLGAGNALSGSRTGFLQLHLMALLLAVWPTSIRSWTVRLQGAALAACWVVAVGMMAVGRGAGVLHRTFEGGQECASRLVLWSNVWDLIASKPLLGWGWGELDYAHYVTLYPGERFCDILDNAHNLPLHLAVEGGLPLAWLFCIALVVAVGRLRPWRETDPARRMAWTVLLLVGLHSLLEYPLWYGPFQMAVGLSIWLLVAARAEDTDASQAIHTAHSLRRTWKSLLAIPILAACAYAAWDYHRISQIYLPPERRAQAYRTDTLARIQDSWLFSNQVRFAELTTTELTPENASKLHAMALSLLHFSPEPRVIEKVIESAMLLDRPEEARFHALRYRRAFPRHYERWAAGLGKEVL